MPTLKSENSPKNVNSVRVVPNPLDFPLLNTKGNVKQKVNPAYNKSKWEWVQKILLILAFC